MANANNYLHFIKNSKENKVSRALTWILRHGADVVHIELDENGWADLEIILALPNFKGVSLHFISEIVRDCPKQRFALLRQEGKTFIKATYGHTVKNLSLDLEEIVAENCESFVYHGTYYKNWPQIKKQGLSRMRKGHIHFSSTFPASPEDSSGIGLWQLVVAVDLKKLLRDGFKVYRSRNSVVLCEGDESGFVPTKYFAQVVDRSTGEDI